MHMQTVPGFRIRRIYMGEIDRRETSVAEITATEARTHDCGNERRAYTEKELCRLLDQISEIRLAIYDRKVDEALGALQKVQGEMRARLGRLRGSVFDQDSETAHFPHQPGKERSREAK